MKFNYLNNSSVQTSHDSIKIDHGIQTMLKTISSKMESTSDKHKTSLKCGRLSLNQEFMGLLSQLGDNKIWKSMKWKDF